MDNLQIELLTTNTTAQGLTFKLIVIGEPSNIKINPDTGKSSLTRRAIDGIFKEDYDSTVGFEFHSLNYKIEDKIVKLQIWDTCGQEIYRSLISNFYKSTALALIVYSIDK
jgi:GTPase SAR1 family protein